MLVWLVLSLGAAVASPLVQPQALELVCSSAGVMKLLVISADGAEELTSVSMDCPLCLHIAAPPPVAHSVSVPFQPLSFALQPVAAAHIAARTASPLPPRGPPAFS